MKGLFFILSLSVCSLFHPAMAQYRSEVWVSDEREWYVPESSASCGLFLIRMSVR